MQLSSPNFTIAPYESIGTGIVLCLTKCWAFWGAGWCWKDFRAPFRPFNPLGITGASLAGKKCKSEAPIAPEIIALCLAPLKIISNPPSGAGLRAHGAINCQCLGGFTQILSCVYLWFQTLTACFEQHLQKSRGLKRCSSKNTIHGCVIFCNLSDGCSLNHSAC